MEKQRIELYGNTSQVMNDAIDRIVIDIYNKGEKNEGAQKILLTGCGPQCGTTSTSIGLAISFAAAKWKTLIIDCDIRKATELKKLNQDTSIGLSDYLLDETADGKVTLSDIIYDTNVEKLSYIPSGKYSANPARLFCSGMMKEFMKYINESYDYVIFDFPSITVTPDAQTLFADVDGIILISALEEVTKKQIKDAKYKVEPYGDKYYGMIVNKIDMGLYRKYVKRYDYYFRDKNGKQKNAGKNAKKYQKKNNAGHPEAVEKKEEK